jgi:hypothetical protein
MSTTAQALLDVMTSRLRMQENGVTNPPQSIRDVTKSLVRQLAALPPDDPIQVVVLRKRPLHAQYIQEHTGFVLAEIADED